MQYTYIRLALLVAACLPLAAPSGDFFRDQQWKFSRVRAAAKEKDETLRQLLGSHGLGYPPKAILLRAFKKEGELELWAKNSGGAYIFVKKYPICAASGILGPKRRFGDGQVPEGFYELDWFNPQSNFYLSLHVSYPNAAERILGSKQNLGGDIFMHGNCVTTGCIPITDDGIMEIYWLSVLARDSGQCTFPSRSFLLA